MKAAVVRAFDHAPRYGEFTTPTPVGGKDMLVDVLAAGLHPRVRSQANGSHYTSTNELPLVPGIDGVGRDAHGELHYFVLPDTRIGSMSEKTVIDARRSVRLPRDIDPVVIAAAMNPAMSSWVALRRRAQFEPGQKLLILGATGNAGRFAVQVGRLFGAEQIVAVGRSPEKLDVLRALGATKTVCLDESREGQDALGEAADDVDVVIDYVWGQPTADALRAIIPKRTDEDQRLLWLQVGSVAGATSPIPSAALRAANLQIVGSGQGAVPARAIVAELPDLVAEIAKGTFQVDARAVPLADVEQTWGEATGSAHRIVFTQ